MDTLQHPELPGGIQEGSISTEVGVTALRRNYITTSATGALSHSQDRQGRRREQTQNTRSSQGAPWKHAEGSAFLGDLCTYTQ